jgi:hypothetical protein
MKVRLISGAETEYVEIYSQYCQYILLFVASQIIRFKEII